MSCRLAALSIAALVMLSACNRDRAPGTGRTAPKGAEARPASVVLQDVIERDPRYLVGISYPPQASKYPGLATALKRYSDDARAGLMQALAEAGPAGGPGSAPYELSLDYTLVAETPTLLSIAANGTRYTGGAHGEPLMARFTWLPAENKLLQVGDLVAAGQLPALSGYVRDQLRAELEQRLTEDDIPAGEREEYRRGALQMLDDGTEPKAENFALFEPVPDADGKRLRALRFVFPPYQVGPYSDGSHQVEVPAASLLPWLTPARRVLFEGG